MGDSEARNGEVQDEEESSTAGAETLVPNMSLEEDLINEDDEEESTRTSGGRWMAAAVRWNKFVQKWYWLVLSMIIVLLWPLGAWSLKDLIHNKTDSTFHPIPGSPSSVAQDAFQRKFPNSTSNNDDMLVVILHSSNQSSIIHHEYAKKTSLELKPYLEQRVNNHNYYQQKHNNDNNTDTSTTQIQISSYYSFQNQNLTSLARPFLSKDHRTTLLQIQYSSSTTDKKTESSDPNPYHPHHHVTVLQEIMSALDEYYSNPPNDLSIQMTGLKYFSNDLRNSTVRDLHRMDSWVLPMALALVGMTLLIRTWVRHGPLCKSLIRGGCSFVWISTIPLVGMISTVAAWSWITDSLIADHFQITQFTPSIMMSLTLGMGIDYTLFLLARYLEEFKSKSETTKSKAVCQMIQHGGKVVLVSGMTLLCTFLGLVGLPMGMLKSIGIGAAVTIASAMGMNLVVVPAVLYTSIGDWIVPTKESEDESQEQQQDQEPTLVHQGAEQQLCQPLLSLENGSSQDQDSYVNPPSPVVVLSSKNSVWIRIARLLLHPYKSIIILLLLCQLVVWPVGHHVTELSSKSISVESLLPASAPSLKAYRFLASEFGGPGKLAPFRILLDGTASPGNHTNATVDSKYSFDVMHKLVQVLSGRSEQDQHADYFWDDEDPLEKIEERLLQPQNDTLSYNEEVSVNARFTGISVINNIPIPYAVYLASKACSAWSLYEDCPVEAMRALKVIDDQMTSNDRLATYLSVELSVSPFSDEGVAWLEQTRKRIQTFQKTHAGSGLNIYVDGSAAIAQDAVQAVYRSFPWMIAITIGVVFILLGLVFQSIVPPLRSIVSISCTLSISFGLAVLVYQDGIWSGAHFRALMPLDPELCWLVPVMSFSIVVGLALDYDVFLVTRILEFRTVDGYQHESSIAAGLDTTGGIITAAGIIMATSFGSLLMSQSPALNQWSFLLMTAVLVDTFVIRTMVVPTLMGMTGTHSWYPRAIPHGHVRLDGFDEPKHCEGVLHDQLQQVGNEQEVDVEEFFDASA